jgi:hypothetical protein
LGFEVMGDVLLLPNAVLGSEAGNVVELKVVTKLDVPPDKLLEKAMGKLTEVVILGFDHDGQEWFASSKADAGGVVWHLERAKHKLLLLVDEMS